MYSSPHGGDERGSRAAAAPAPAVDAQGTALHTVSVVDAVAEALRERILSGTIAPGTQLRETQVAAEFGVARHSFRAAAHQLVHEGLLRRAPNRGVHVPILDAEDIADVLRLRGILELEAVRSAIEQGRCPEAMVAAVEELSALDDRASWREVVDADMRFHRALIDATGSPRFVRAYATVASEILLCLVSLRTYYQRPEQVAAEHRELLEAIQRRDAGRAEELFRVHLDDAARNLTSALQTTDREETR